MITQFRMAEDETLDADKLKKFIDKAKTSSSGSLKLQKAYQGEYEIYEQEKKAQYKPDNRLGVNFAKYITDTFNGFFIGNPIKTTCDDETISEFVESVEAYNDQDDNNAELSRLMSIYGHAYEMYFVDDDKQISITYLDPLTSFMIYNESLVEKPLYFVHWYKDSNNVERGSVSDSEVIRYFHMEAGSLAFDEEIPHDFDGVPATEFIENEERLGIFETCMPLINAYNKALSEKANDVDYFADAYMKILGAELSDKDLQDLRANRIINLPGDPDTDLSVEFMAKPSADQTQENLLNKIERLIYQTAMVPNINDESFGTSSGIAMQYKLLNTLNMFKGKQRKFESGMNRRWKLIFSHPLALGSVKPDDWAKLRYSFTPNIPANALEEAQTAAQLSGIVSRKTQLEALSIVDNVANELQRIEEEETAPDLLGFDAHEAMNGN